MALHPWLLLLDLILMLFLVFGTRVWTGTLGLILGSQQWHQKMKRRRRSEIQNKVYWSHSQEALWGICVEYHIFYDSPERIKQGGRIDTSREKWKNSTRWWKNSRLKVCVAMRRKAERECGRAACWEQCVGATQGVSDWQSCRETGLITRRPVAAADMPEGWAARLWKAWLPGP